jgi:hypothetical protein
MNVADAIRTLSEAGAVFSVPADRHLSPTEAAKVLDCSVWYVRKHLDEFPGAWRMPGGDIRIPSRDVEALAKRNRIKR